MSIRQSPYVGIGLRLTSRLEVHEVIPGGATAACGLIEQGDRLLVIDGVNVEGKKPAEVSSMIVGPSGSSIELSIHSKRTGSRFSVNIVRGSQLQAGVGILLISTIGNEIYVERLERNGAAQVGGVLEGDVLKEINGVDASAISVRDVTSLMAGPEGSTLLLRVLRGPQRKPFDFALTRTMQIAINSNTSTPTRASSASSVPDSPLFPPEVQPVQAGVGILLQRNGAGELLVHSLEPSGSAFSAGVQESDVIEKVDGKNVMGKAVRDVVPLIAGNAGSEIILTILRGPNRNRLEFSMKRARIRAVSPISCESPILGCEKESPMKSYFSSLFGGKDENIPADAQGGSSTRSPREAATFVANPEVKAQRISSDDLATRSPSSERSPEPISPEWPSKTDNRQNDWIDKRNWIGSPGKAIESTRDSQTSASRPISSSFYNLTLNGDHDRFVEPKSQSLSRTKEEVCSDGRFSPLIGRKTQEPADSDGSSLPEWVQRDDSRYNSKNGNFRQPGKDRQSAEYHRHERNSQSFLPAQTSSSPARRISSGGLSTNEGSRGSSRGSRSPSTGINQRQSDVLSVYQRSSRGVVRESSRSPIRDIDKWQLADVHRHHDAQKQMLEKKLRDLRWTVDMSVQKKADEQSAMKRTQVDLDLAELRKKVEMAAQKLQAEEKEAMKRKEAENQSRLRQLEQEKEAILILLSKKSADQMAIGPGDDPTKVNSQNRGSDGMWRDSERQDEDELKQNQVPSREFADIPTLPSTPRRKGSEQEISPSMLDKIENDSKTQLPVRQQEDSYKNLAGYHLTAHRMSSCGDDDEEVGDKTTIWRRKPQDSFKLTARRMSSDDDEKEKIAEEAEADAKIWRKKPQDSFKLTARRMSIGDDEKEEIAEEADADAKIWRTKPQDSFKLTARRMSSDDDEKEKIAEEADADAKKWRKRPQDSFKLTARRMSIGDDEKEEIAEEADADAKKWRTKPQDSLKLTSRRMNDISRMSTIDWTKMPQDSFIQDWTKMPQDSFVLAASRLSSANDEKEKIAEEADAETKIWRKMPQDSSREEIPTPQRLLSHEDVFDKFDGRLQVDVREDAVEASFKNAQSQNTSVREVLEEQERLKKQIKILELKAQLESERIKLEAKLREKQKNIYEREIRNVQEAKSPRSSATRPGGVLPPSSSSNRVLSPRSAYSSQSERVSPSRSEQRSRDQSEERSREQPAARSTSNRSGGRSMSRERLVRHGDSMSLALNPDQTLSSQELHEKVTDEKLLSSTVPQSGSERPLVNMAEESPLGSILGPILGPAMSEAQKSEKNTLMNYLGIKNPWHSGKVTQSNQTRVTAGPATTEFQSKNSESLRSSRECRNSQERVRDAPVVDSIEPIKAAASVPRILASKSKFTGNEEISYGAPVPGRVSPQRLRHNGLPSENNSPLSSPRANKGYRTDTKNQNVKLSSESLYLPESQSDRSSSLAQASRDEDTHGSRAYNNGINTQGLNERKGPLLRKIHNVHMQVLAADEMNDPNSSIRSISPVHTIQNNGRSTSPVRIDKNGRPISPILRSSRSKITAPDEGGKLTSSLFPEDQDQLMPSETISSFPIAKTIATVPSSPRSPPESRRRNSVPESPRRRNSVTFSKVQYTRRLSVCED